MGDAALEIDLEAEAAKVERDKVLKEVAKQWNTIIISLMKATKAWDAYIKARLDADVRIEEFPLEYQKILLLANPRGEFDVILEDMILHGRNLVENLKTQLIKIK